MTDTSGSAGPEEVRALKRCLACGSIRLRFLLEHRSVLGPETRRFLTCDECGTVLDESGLRPEYHSDIAYLGFEVPLYVRYYAEVGAGLLFLAAAIALLKRAGPTRDAQGATRFLDVGGGLGYAASMAQMVGWDAVGIDPSAVADWSHRMLGVRTIRAYIEEADLLGEPFDLAFSSEVIEHVSDPAAFVASIARHLSPSGVLLLTTPNASMIADDTEREWPESLGVGQHLCVLTPQALQMVLQKAGFNDVRLFLSEGTYGMKRIIAIASRQHMEIADSIRWSDVVGEGRGLLIAYLRWLVSEKEGRRELDSVYEGALFRLFEELANRGDYRGAERYEVKLQQILSEKGLTEERLARVEATSFAEYMARAPAYAGLYFFYRGLLSLNHRRGFVEARKQFDAAAHLCRVEARVGYFTREGWPERARFHEGLAYLYAGEQRRAVAIFDELLQQQASLPSDLAGSVYRSKAIAHLQLRENFAALHSFSASALKKEAITPQELRDVLLHGLVAVGQVVEDMQRQMETVSGGLRDLSAAATKTSQQLEGALQRILDLYREDRQLLRGIVGSGVELLEKTTAALSALLARLDAIARAIYTPLRVLGVPFRLARRWTNPKGIVTSDDGSQLTTGELVVGACVEQAIKPERDGLAGLRLKVGTFRRVNMSQLLVEILDRDRKVIRSVVQVAKGLRDNQFNMFQFGPIPESSGKDYWVRLSSPDATTGDGVTFWWTRGRATGLRLNGKPARGSLICELQYASEAANLAEANSILIVTPDRLGKVRVGLGMRHWEIAKALAARGLRVTLATPWPVPSDLKGEGFTLRSVVNAADVVDLAADHPVVMLQGDILERYPRLEVTRARIVVDLVTPIHIEDLDKGEKAVSYSGALVLRCLRRGDFFICGNERQRLYWLGMLTTFGRLSIEGHREDRTFRNLIDIVGFGLPSEPARKVKTVLRGVVPGIGRDDFILIWFGGLWDWLDPFTLIRAVSEAHSEDQRVKVFFPALRRPNGEMPDAAERAVRLAEELAMHEKSVFFNEYPIPYEERGDYLLESDVGVICQASSLETEVSARTRVLDYIWAGLPILINEGDDWSDRVGQQDLGLVVPHNTVECWKDAILALARNPEERARKAVNVARAREEHRWARVVQPLLRYVRGQPAHGRHRV